VPAEVGDGCCTDRAILRPATRRSRISTSHVSGQGPVDPDTGDVIEGSPAEQTRRTLDNVAAILRAGDAPFDDIVKTTVHLTDMRYYDEVNDVYGDPLPEPYPARSVVEVVKLPVDIDVEIEAVVTLREDDTNY